MTHLLGSKVNRVQIRKWWVRKRREASGWVWEKVAGMVLMYLQGSQPHVMPLPHAKSRPSQRCLLERAVLGSGPATLFSQMGIGGLGGGGLS